MPKMSGRPMRLIDIKNLSIQRGRQQILHGVDLTVTAGEIITIVGPNGSGKSTLLKAMIGAIAPSAGTVTPAPDLSIGYVPQKLEIDATFPITVKRFLSIPTPVPVANAKQALDLVGGSALFSKDMRDLSGGQFQRAMLARALLQSPNLLLLDEPTQGLDQPGSANFYRMIEQIRTDLGCAIVMVSHELHVVMSTTDRVICLNGHVCCHGTPDVVSNAPEYRALFGDQTGGALALYRHEHKHSHHDHGEDGEGCNHA